MKSALKIVLRVGISMGLLFVVLRRTDFKEIFGLLRQADIGIFLISFLGYALLVILSALRWHKLLLVQKVEIPYKRTLAYYLIGFFYNNFLPAVFGGGVVRALYAGRLTKKNKETFSSMITEILLGGWGLIAFAIIVSLIWFSSTAIRALVLPLLGGFIVVSIIIYLFFERGFMIKFKGIVERIELFDLGDKLKKFYNAMYVYKDKKGVILEVVLLSFGIQVTIALMNLSIGLSLGFKLPLMSYIVYPAIIAVITAIPITINGLGLREWGYRFFFAQVGLGGAQAITLSLLFYFVSVVGSLSGGIIFPFMKFKGNKDTSSRT